jgi:hypothetical protein
MDFAKVKGYDGLVRDMNTGAIINNDSSAIEARKKSKNLTTAIEDINNLKEEISEIKALLHELIKNGNS